LKTASLPKKPSLFSSALRWLLICALLGGLGWGGTLGWKKWSPGLFGTQRDTKLPTTSVANASLSEEIIAVGRVRAVFSTELRSEINGRIIKLLAKDGQPVKRDDEILRLDQQDLLTQIQESERLIEASRLRMERARRDWLRYAALDKNGLITGKDAEDSRTTLSLAENETSVAEARLANLKDRLAKTSIRAPFDGTLLLRDLTEGQVITGVGAQSGGTLLGEVADLTALMVRTNINEIDVARLKMEDRARVRVDPLRTVILEGTVRRIATSAVESAVDRTRVFPVDVILDKPDPRLRPGMSSTITFTLARVENVPAVLLSAVFSTANDSGQYVFVRQGERFRVREVQTGIADTHRVQILSGLAIGEEVSLTRPVEFDGELPDPTAVASRPRS
jgi:RND family efflux transporter MFP subunit